MGRKLSGIPLKLTGRMLSGLPLNLKKKKQDVLHDARLPRRLENPHPDPCLFLRSVRVRRGRVLFGVTAQNSWKRLVRDPDGSE